MCDKRNNRQKIYIEGVLLHFVFATDSDNAHIDAEAEPSSASDDFKCHSVAERRLCGA